MKAAELRRIRDKILKLKMTYSDAALWEALCKEEAQFCKEFWGEDFMCSFGDQSPGYFAHTWALSFEKTRGRFT